MNAEVFAQHIRCVHLLRGLCFRGKETASVSISCGRARPIPPGVFIHLMPHPGVCVWGGLESNLWRQCMGAELWLLLRRPPQPPGPWGASKGPEPIARRGWDKRRDKKSHFFFLRAPPLSLLSIILGLLSPWRSTHLIIIERVTKPALTPLLA